VSWYLALLVRGSSIDGVPDSDAMGDILYRVIEATDAEGAYTRALEQGNTCGETLTDLEGRTVTMTFIGLADIVAIGSPVLENGVEVYSQLIEKEPGERVVLKEQLTVFAPDEPLIEADQPIFGRARTEEDAEG
jgi:Domain of unknown function (DUF4288)